jgi:hypothetical protein
MLKRFETRSEALLSRKHFAKRLLKFWLYAMLIEVLVLLIGSVGFHYFEGLDWLNAMLNTAMVVTGNGPPFIPQSDAGKIFQIIFSLIGVIIFVLLISLVLVPIFHRILHAFNLGDSGDVN